MQRTTVRGLIPVVTVFHFLIVLNVYAQERQDESWNDQFDFRLSSPAITFEYGPGTGSLKGLERGPQGPAMFQLKMGGIRYSIMDVPTKVLRFKFDYFSVANGATRFRVHPPGEPVRTEFWRFGPAWEKGYGYGFGRSAGAPSVVIYHSQGLLWLRLNVEDSATVEADRDLLALFNEKFRFGTRAEGGVKVRAASFLTVDAAYERSVVFRRHLFWKWLGSAMLEGLSHWLLDRFINEIRDSSPVAVPIVNGLLKNALSYAVYQLRKDKMNYPFSSEPPLLIDTFKVGMTFVF